MRQDYFFVPGPVGEYTTEEVPLYINCAGYTDGDAVFTSRIPAGRKDYAIYYMTVGKMEFSLNGAPFAALLPGSFIVIPAGTPVVYRHTERAEKGVFWAHFTGSYVASLLGECGIGNEGGIFPGTLSDAGPFAFQSLLDEMKGPPTPTARLRAAAALIHLLTVLVELREGKLERHRLRRSLSYLQEHYTEPIDKTALASIEGLGISQYNLLFRKLTGYSPAAYIQKLRISLAQHLLADPERPVGEVARRCGYDDPLYFCRVFRRECGISPTAYRRGEPIRS